MRLNQDPNPPSRSKGSAGGIYHTFREESVQTPPKLPHRTAEARTLQPPAGRPYPAAKLRNRHQENGGTTACDDCPETLGKTPASCSVKGRPARPSGSPSCDARAVPPTHSAHRHLKGVREEPRARNVCRRRTCQNSTPFHGSTNNTQQTRNGTRPSQRDKRRARKPHIERPVSGE